MVQHMIADTVGVADTAQGMRRNLAQVLALRPSKIVDSLIRDD